MDLQQWVCNSNDVVKMHLLPSDEINVSTDQPGFSPELTWTFFGKEEKIWGYKGLKIDFWWKADTLDLHLAIRLARFNKFLGGMSE
jgi:Histone acetyl transferase HAT1 N-terminus